MKRWPIIRHARWAVLAWRLERWWRDIGRYLGAIRNPADMAYLDKVWKGEA